MDLDSNLQLILTFAGGTVVAKLVDFVIAQFKVKRDDAVTYREDIRHDLKELKDENDRMSKAVDELKKENLALQLKYEKDKIEQQARYDKLELDREAWKKRYSLLLDKLKKHPDLYENLKGEFELEVPPT